MLMYGLKSWGNYFITTNLRSLEGGVRMLRDKVERWDKLILVPLLL